MDVGKCCTMDQPCDEGEGDCKDDFECSGDLVCGNNNCQQFGNIFHEKDDCCTKPGMKISSVITNISSNIPSEPGPNQRCAGRNYQVVWLHKCYPISTLIRFLLQNCESQSIDKQSIEEVIDKTLFFLILDLYTTFFWL